MSDTLKKDFETAKAIIRKLPQAKHYTREAVMEWFRHVIALEPERMVWHATRLNGVGGSEIGPVVRFYLELKADAEQIPYSSEFGFGDVQSVYKHKMLLTQIERPNSDMLRGTRSEPLARDAYIEKLRRNGHTVEVDIEAIKSLETYKDQQYPWLRYSPDDVLIIDGRRVLVDYKCPDESPLSNTVYFDYEAQLNHGAVLLKRAGFPVHQASLVKYQVMTCELNAIDVPLKLEQEILEAGDWFWNKHVMTATPTPYKPPELPSISKVEIEELLKEATKITDGVGQVNDEHISQLVSQLRSHALHYGQMQMLSKAITSQTDAAAKAVTDTQKEISAIAPSVYFKHEIGPTVVTTKANEVLDEKSLISVAEEMGVDLTEYHKTKIDHSALFEAVKDRLTAEQLAMISSTEISHKATLSRKTKGPTGEIVATLSATSKALADEIESGISGTLQSADSIISAQDQYLENAAKYHAWASDRWQAAVNELNSSLNDGALILPDYLDMDDLLPSMTP